MVTAGGMMESGDAVPPCAVPVKVEVTVPVTGAAKVPAVALALFRSDTKLVSVAPLTLVKLATGTAEFAADSVEIIVPLGVYGGRLRVLNVLLSGGPMAPNAFGLIAYPSVVRLALAVPPMLLRPGSMRPRKSGTLKVRLPSPFPHGKKIALAAVETEALLDTVTALVATAVTVVPGATHDTSTGAPILMFCVSEMPERTLRPEVQMRFVVIVVVENRIE